MHEARRSSLGRTLIIANPAARSGAGAGFAERLQRFLLLYHGSPGVIEDPITFDLEMTEYPGHATALAETSQGFDTVLALGGDGTVHEVVNGLMRIDRDRRPVLGVVPVGSGNDYARTLGIDHALDKTFAPLLGWRPRRMDVGRIETDPRTVSRRTVYFAQTFSVGIDAAIGLGTVDLRAEQSYSGDMLYIASGLRHFGRRYRTYPMTVGFDGRDGIDRDVYTMAVQVGATYGSGFAICPEADPTDGLFDVSYAAGPASRLVTLPTFLLARLGKAALSPLMHGGRARAVSIALPAGDYPIQADGEAVHAAALGLTCLYHELEVLQPA